MSGALDRDLDGLLTTQRLGRVHEHHTQLASTNDRALAWLSGGAPDGALVTADAQTAGRGRLGRVWSSPPGQDIYASVILRPGAPEAGFGALALAVGVGLREGILQACGGQRAWADAGAPELSLKWPNDLLLGERKLAGILCESRWRGSQVELVVGFGVNVSRPAEAFALELRDTATSLAIGLEGDRVPARAELLAGILHALEFSLERFLAGGFPAIRARYEPHCLVLGREIEVESPGGARLPARAVGLDEDGALLVERADGATVRVQSADVWLR